MWKVAARKSNAIRKLQVLSNKFRLIFTVQDKLLSSRLPTSARNYKTYIMFNFGNLKYLNYFYGNISFIGVLTQDCAPCAASDGGEVQTVWRSAKSAVVVDIRDWRQTGKPRRGPGGRWPTPQPDQYSQGVCRLIYFMLRLASPHG